MEVEARHTLSCASHEVMPVTGQGKSQGTRQVHSGILAISVMNSRHEMQNLTPRGDAALSLNESDTMPLGR